jgi:hypothetical protein
MIGCAVLRLLGAIHGLLTVSFVVCFAMQPVSEAKRAPPADSADPH